MADFAVRHEGLPEGAGRWVLQVDAPGERLLLADEEKHLYWMPISTCELFAVHTPSQPTAVVIVQPQQQAQAGLVMPEMNRAMRRNGIM